MNTPKGLLRPVAEESDLGPPPAAILPVTDEELLMDSDVMKLLKVKKTWLRDHTTRVEPIIPHLRIGREIRYLRSDVLAWCRAQRETRPRWEREDAA
jgi:hypothetical protein